MSTVHGKIHSLQTMAERAESQLRPAPQAEIPFCVTTYSEALQAFLTGVQQARDAKQEAYVATLQSLAKRATTACVSRMRLERESAELRPMPTTALYLLEVFGGLKKPTADEYRRYEKAFQAFPAVLEFLRDKYDADALTGYTPKDASGTVYELEPLMSDSDVETQLDSLLQKTTDLIDADSGNTDEQQIAASVLEAGNPVAVISAVTGSTGAEIQALLKAIDCNYHA